MRGYEYLVFKKMLHRSQDKMSIIMCRRNVFDSLIPWDPSGLSCLPFRETHNSNVLFGGSFGGDQFLVTDVSPRLTKSRK